MMRLFGGFGPAVFDAYGEAFPLADGVEDRVALNQVVPLLAHVILFGATYVPQLTAAVGRYVPVR
jgi:fructosamine-3-kinase